MSDFHTKLAGNYEDFIGIGPRSLVEWPEEPLGYEDMYES